MAGRTQRGGEPTSIIADAVGWELPQRLAGPIFPTPEQSEKSLQADVLRPKDGPNARHFGPFPVRKTGDLTRLSGIGRLFGPVSGKSMATADVSPVRTSSARWPAVPAAAALVVLVGVLYQPTALALVRLWNTEPHYLFGYLIPALSLLTALASWRREGGPLRDRVAPADVRRGTFFLLLGCAAHVAATFVDSLPLDVLGLMMILRGAVQVYGGDVVRRYDPAILLLVFLLPVSLDVVPSLTATFARWVVYGAAQLLDAVGIPTYCEGTVVQLSDFTLVANAASSGLRELEGTFALCLALGFLGGCGWLTRGTLIVLSLPIALAVNGLRIVTAGLAYHERGRPAAERVLQLYDGWVPVGVATGLAVAAALVCYALATSSADSTKETA